MADANVELSDEDTSRKAELRCKYSTSLTGTELLFLRKCCPSELQKFESEVGRKIAVKAVNQGNVAPLSGLDRAQYDVTIVSDRLTQEKVEAQWKALMDYAHKKLRRVELTVSETRSADVDALCKTVKEVMKKMGKVFISNTDDKSVTVAGLGMFPNMLRSFVMEAVPSSSPADVTSDEESDDSVKVVQRFDAPTATKREVDVNVNKPSTSKGGYSRVAASAGTDSEESEPEPESESEPFVAKSKSQAQPVAPLSLTTWQNTGFGSFSFSSAQNKFTSLKTGTASRNAISSDNVLAGSFQRSLQIGLGQISKNHEVPTTLPKVSQKCGICLNVMNTTDKDALATTPCTHTFHRNCLRNALNSAAHCPTCGAACNLDLGVNRVPATIGHRFSFNRPSSQSSSKPALRSALATQDRRVSSSSTIVRRNKQFDILSNPLSIAKLRELRNMPEGQMQVRVEQEICVPDYPDHGCIILLYSFPKAVLGEHGSPGEPIAAYLPNTSQGRRVSTLLQTAFKDCWTFVNIGDNTKQGLPIIAWGPLTHKTELFGDPEAPNFYSYPDAGYMDRIKKELELLGYLPSEDVESD